MNGLWSYLVVFQYLWVFSPRGRQGGGSFFLGYGHPLFSRWWWAFLKVKVDIVKYKLLSGGGSSTNCRLFSRECVYFAGCFTQRLQTIPEGNIFYIRKSTGRKFTYSHTVEWNADRQVFGGKLFFAGLSSFWDAFTALTLHTSWTHLTKAAFTVFNVVWSWRTHQHCPKTGKILHLNGNNFDWDTFTVPSLSPVIVVLSKPLFLTWCTAAPSWPARRRHLETELCDWGPVLLPCWWGSGSLHQWGLPHGGRNSSAVQAEVQRGWGVKGAEWVRLFIKYSWAVKMLSGRSIDS